MTNAKNPDVIRILLVEDDEDDARIARAMIMESPEVRDLPVMITHLPSMKDVLKTLADANPPFHSVLIDLGMLGASPLKTLEAIRAFCPNVQTNTSKTDSPAAHQVEKSFPVLSKDLMFGQESALSQQLLGTLGEERRAREDASRRYGKEFREISIKLVSLETNLSMFQQQIYTRQVTQFENQIDDLKEVIEELQEMVPINAIAIGKLDSRIQVLEDALTGLRQELANLRQGFTPANFSEPPKSAVSPEAEKKVHEESLKDKLAIMTAQYKWQLIGALVTTLTSILIARYAPHDAVQQLNAPPPSFPPTATPAPPAATPSPSPNKS